jgi:SHS family lactate transporter-like MFS transporter
MASTSPSAPPPTREERRNQRNAVLAGFLGWTFDAFDFFVLTFIIDDVAKAFGHPRADITLALTLALAMRPVGAVVFGLLADRYGRRTPLMINVVFYATVSVLSGLSPNYLTFMILRALFGVGMGGEWGVGASLALESASPKLRGLLSGLLQEGYAIGNLLASLTFLVLYPIANEMYPGNGWRAMFFVGGLPALLSFYIRRNVKESEAWHEHRTDWTTYRRSLLQHWPRFLYLVLLMAMMNFMSHGTQDMYPTLLKSFGFEQKRIALITALSMVGAVVGGLAFGYYSDRAGRRRAMMTAAMCGLVVIPFWLSGQSMFRTVMGVILMQFFVQGAWGVIPAHINELSPGHLRGFFPGFAYQLGVLCAASIPYVEEVLAEHFSYAQAMGSLVAVIFVVATIVIWRGPEAHGVTFRKRVEPFEAMESGG